jgi:hypothetical protein
MCDCAKWVNGIPPKPGFYVVRNNKFSNVVVLYCKGGPLSSDSFHVFDSLDVKPKVLQKWMSGTWDEFIESMQYKKIV